MCVEGEQDVAGLMAIGRIVGLALRTMAERIEPGMTTRQLDQIGWDVLRRHGAQPAPFLTYGFPGVACISVNDEAAHGVPGKRVIRKGDLVKIDVSAALDGYFADAAITVAVPPVAPDQQRLADCARAAFESALRAARAGARLSEIGKAAESVTHGCGFRVIRELPGHGVGRALHEPPHPVPMWDQRSARGRLTEGLVITIEPHISAGSRRLITAADGWTLKTADGSLAAAYEHTVIITSDRPIVVTAV